MAKRSSQKMSSQTKDAQGELKLPPFYSIELKPKVCMSKKNQYHMLLTFVFISPNVSQQPENHYKKNG